MQDTEDPFVVVGGDAAGLSAASKFKREAPDRDVIVFERGQWVSYAHCGLPYYVKGEVEQLTALTSLSPAEIEDRGIDLRRGHEVVAIDTDEKTVTTATPNGRREHSYAELLLATGARAVAGPFDLDLGGVFTIHGLDSAAALRAYLTDPSEIDLDSVNGEAVDRDWVARCARKTPPETAAIVGGGYVGVEMAEALAAWDLDVHLFQRGPELIPPFGDAVASTVADHLRDQGVTVHAGTAVTGLAADGDDLAAVDYESGSLDTRLAVVGVGIRPNVDLATGTPIQCGSSGAIAVDDHGRTTVSDVYAAGDCAEATHVVTDKSTWVPLGLTANRAGRAIGATVAGDRTPVGSVAGTAVLKAFELECGRTGLLASEAEEAGFDPVSRTITAGSRSGYYPGAADTTVTLVGDRDSGRLLGGSIVGRDRAAVRINAVATALEGELAVSAVERLDLGYAPPFSPVWDPVLVAAKVLTGALGEQSVTTD